MKLLAFAQARETFGFSEKEIELQSGETPRQLMERVAPGTSLEGLRVAIDQAFVDWDAPLSQANEMALIPPVSGG